MKLTIYQSDEGDCLLLEGRDDGCMLCDGGKGPSMRKQVRQELSQLPGIDFIYVSHIDEDHIGGVLQLLQDEADWRVFEHHQNNNEETKKPAVPKPPNIGGILFNAFRDLIADNNKPLESIALAQGIEQLLTGLAPSLAATAVPALTSAAQEMQNISTGIPSALRISKLAAADALDIPINRPPGIEHDSKLLFAGQPGDVFDLGSMHFTLIGPTDEELKQLREGWNHWLKSNKKRLNDLKAEIRKRVDEFSTGDLAGSPFDLSTWEGLPGHEGVTVPNIASLMWMVEEGDGDQLKRLLLTGDGQEDFILAGLQRAGFLGTGAQDGLHLDVLKVQHHGSPNNLDVDFAKKVSADHYVFCGDGLHTNPDIEVIDIIYNSRIGDDQTVHALAPQAVGRDFHFWFSTTSEAQTPGTKKREYFKKVEDHVAELVSNSDGKMHSHYNEAVGIVLEI